MGTSESKRRPRFDARRRTACFALAIAVAGSLGCSAKAAPAPAAPPGTATGLTRYLPLEDGTVFSYETSTEPPTEPGLLILEVRRPRANVAELVVAGRARRLNLTDSAVAHASGGFLLREPLTVGTTWHGDFGRVRVTRVDVPITVRAGTFAGCIETIEEVTTREGQKRTTTAFCPGVGIAVRETEAEQGAMRQSERIALKNYGKKFDPAAQ
jgi:hypothetical protein